MTSAFLALRIYLGQEFEYVVVPFDEILDVVERLEARDERAQVRAPHDLLDQRRGDHDLAGGRGQRGLFHLGVRRFLKLDRGAPDVGFRVALDLDSLV